MRYLPLLLLFFALPLVAKEVPGTITANNGTACETVFRYGHGSIYLSGALGTSGTLNIQWFTDAAAWTTAKSMTSLPSDPMEYYHFGRENTRIRAQITGASSSPSLTCIFRPNTDK